MITEQTKDAIKQLQKQYPEKRSALIPALHIVQSEKGFLSLETQKEVADLFEIDPNEVNAVVTFYDMFYEKPVGKHLIHVCKNVSCLLKGAEKILSGVCHRLQVRPGETTEDGQYTVIASECLAACDRAPMLMVDDQVIGPVKEEQIDAILNDSKNSKGHAAPISKEDLSYA